MSYCMFAGNLLSRRCDLTELYSICLFGDTEDKLYSGDPFIARLIIVNILWNSILISLHNMLPFELTKDTQYLALSGEQWSVFYEYLNRM